MGSARSLRCRAAIQRIAEVNRRSGHHDAIGLAPGEALSTAISPKP
jgi:hypothetical protein